MSEREQMNPLEEFRDPCDCDPSCGEDCMADDHALYAMANEIVRLRAHLTAAERERDEVRRELAVLRDTVLVERQAIEQLRHRAERAERVVEAAKRWERAWFSSGDLVYVTACDDLLKAVRALDAAEGK